MSDNTATDSESTFSPNIVRGILEGLKIQKDNSDFTDIRVVIDNCEFKCHRVILAACSEFFKALLSSGMKEDLEKKVEIKDILVETFSDILECIYTGKNILNELNMFESWHAANQLQIRFLLSECEIFLKQKISTENCLAIYQNSKLLDSKEMTQFSWAYILQQFETLRRSDEILMLTETDMKQLIASQDLNTHSEDGVVETILRWIAYKPSEAASDDASRYEYFDKKFETSQECLQNSTTCSTESQEGLVPLENRNQQVQVVLPSATVQEKGYDNKKKSVNRADHLCDLLKVAKICLLSGKCLMELMRNDLISADKQAKDILAEGFEYHMRTDKRHHFCPSSAVNRSSGLVENVIVGINTAYNNNILVCRKQNGQWYNLGKPAIRGNNLLHSAICFNHNVYVALENQQMYVYITFTNQWKELPRLTIEQNVKCILSLGNFLYAIHKDVSNSIEMINLTEVFDSKGQWIKAGKLTLESMNITCTTIVGDKIIFFGSVPGKSNIVLVFDTVTLTCSQLNDIPSLSAVAVSFCKGEDSFVLQNNGELYRITSSCEPPFIEIKYETMLWDFDRILQGAILFNDELLLFGPSFSSTDSDMQWKISVQGVFNCIKNIICSEEYSCFMHTVIPKMYLQNIFNL